MTAHRLLAVAVVAALIVGCGGQTTIPPSALPTPASAAPATAAESQVTPDDPDVAALLARAAAQAGQALGTEDLIRRALIESLDLRADLGTDGDHILAVALAAEAAAAEQAPLRPAASASTSPPAEAQLANAVVSVSFVLALVQTLPPPLAETRDYLSFNLDSIGREGSNTNHEDTGTQRASASDGGVASSSEMRTTIDITIAGSDVTVVAERDVHTTATDSVTGSPLLDSHIHYQVSAELDACPSAAGLVKASSGHAYTAEASTFAGDKGRVGSHNTSGLTTHSTFTGHVDDGANLGNVTQDATVDGQFRRTAAATGGPEASHEGTFATSVTGINDGVPSDHAWSITGGDWSEISSVTADRTGDARVDQVGDAAGSAAVDWATIDAPFVAAQRLWRDTRCVIVTVPTYIPLSAYAHNARPSHTEEVGTGSTTTFEVATAHRFDQKVTARIEATLDGKESLDPKEVSKPPGTLTYVAPGEDGETAIVDLVSTSKQGIGRQRLLFHTSDEQLKVSINGTMTTSGFGVSYTTKVAVSGILLTRQSDGTFLGSAPVTTIIQLHGDLPCPAPYKEQGGTLTLRATHPPPTDPSTPSPWTIRMDGTSKLTVSGSCLGVSLGDMLALGQNGATGGFMFVLGDVIIPAAGGSAVVKKTVTLGASQNAINATVTAQVIKDVRP